MMNSLFPVLCTESVDKSHSFYKNLFSMQAAFEIDWYVQLQSPENVSIQIAFVKGDHPSVPERFRAMPAGTIVTLEVEDADRYYRKAKELGLTIEMSLRDEPWGQRHFMVVDPSGVLVDVVKLIEPSKEFIEHYQS